ncbi:MarR family winged helix-turn-helix transcriptional regulator [Streptosporangium amethystogenes]|uniref:MarR family winged helix-turn-helix transcriptional regulator n=1 Tax=Streptosporangium amethystogenes TaxID=2002 RepID=UPI000A7491B1|nr:MarR family transcriptional regulator [Streptosporangium amethystogenes]
MIEYETMLLGRYYHLTLSRAEREGDHLDRSAYVLLSRIQLVGPMSIGQLSEAFDLDPSTLNRQTSAILRAGLVERIPDPDGGIARKFRISAEGERRLQYQRDEIVRSMDKILDDWTPEEVATFAACLQRFNTDIERLTGRPWPRP